MGHHSFHPLDVCSRRIDYDIDRADRILHNVKFTGGCDGNLKALGALVEGMHMDEAIRRLSGIRCGDNYTSCADQFARALSGIKELIDAYDSMSDEEKRELDEKFERVRKDRLEREQKK